MATNKSPKEENDKISCIFPFFSPIVYPIRKTCGCILPHIRESDLTCHYRPLLAIGLFWIYILRKLFVIPFSGGVCALGVVHAAKKKEPETCDPNRQLIRACDLPLYTEEKQCTHCLEKKAAAECPEKSLLEETITCTRKELWFLMDQAKIVKGEVAEALGSAFDHANSGIEFLREETNLFPRAGAIGIGGLAGYIFGLRKRLITRLFYTTIGAGAMAALCYPREAKEYSKEALEQARKYTLIGYHFLNGVSRDLTGYQLPALPLGHFLVSDSPHPPSEAVPSAEHLLPPTVTPVHIPLPGEDEALKHNTDQNAKGG